MSSDLSDILKERDSRYGSYTSMARTSQALKVAISTGDSYDFLSNAQAESLSLIANKISRIVNGDPDYKDSWQDIAGYAQLIVNLLPD